MTETSQATRHTADIVIVDTDRNILLIERSYAPYPGHWALPGGHVDTGETPLEAAGRELREETGLLVPAADLRHIGTWGTPGRDPRGHYVTHAYLAVVRPGMSTTAGDDARRAEWWPLDAMPGQLAFDHADIIAAAANTL
ncbi:NUDIX domain-containing protein [Streptomyces sp. NPDC015144]|uniref:NUDIX domain-containing protein n=1 Tax=Streptomyces sp. NPDC015144 TaxID=3364944 RepID=UPI0036F61E16